MRALLALLLAAAPVALAELPVELPDTFHRVADASLEETAALVPLAVQGDPPRRLVELYRQAPPAMALFALSIVDAPLELEPTSKTLLASAVSAHFKRHLGLEFELERTSFLPSPTQRVEVWGVATGAAGRRAVAVAFYPGARHHLVALASCPLEASPALRGSLSSAFASMRPPVESASLLRERRLLSVAFWGLAALTLVGLRVLRRTDRSKR
jgi:hypothetical protein